MHPVDAIRNQESCLNQPLIQSVLNILTSQKDSCATCGAQEVAQQVTGFKISEEALLLISYPVNDGLTNCQSEIENAS